MCLYLKKIENQQILKDKTDKIYFPTHKLLKCRHSAIVMDVSSSFPELSISAVTHYGTAHIEAKLRFSISPDIRFNLTLTYYIESHICALGWLLQVSTRYVQIIRKKINVSIFYLEQKKEYISMTFSKIVILNLMQISLVFRMGLYL